MKFQDNSHFQLPRHFSLSRKRDINARKLHGENGKFVREKLRNYSPLQSSDIAGRRSASARDIPTSNATAPSAEQRITTTGSGSPSKTATRMRPSSARSAVDDLKSIIRSFVCEGRLSCAVYTNGGLPKLTQSNAKSVRTLAKLSAEISERLPRSFGHSKRRPTLHPLQTKTSARLLDGYRGNLIRRSA